MGSFLSINYVSTYWTSNNPVLPSGEMGLEIDTGKFKIGDGATAWNSLSYGFPPSVTYDSVAQQIDAQAFEDHSDCVIPEGGFQVNDTMVVASLNPITWTGAPNGGGGGSGNVVQTVVDFGKLTPEETQITQTVSATWVTASSKLFSAVVEGQEHTDDEIAAEQVTATTGNVVPGAGFDVVVSSMQGSTGKFLVNIVGF